MKRFLIAATALLFFGTSIAGVTNDDRDGKPALRTVVIDAGHGGKDPGAKGLFAYEKDIALAIALKLGNYIEKNHPEVKVIYTRTTDEFIELINRANVANIAKADLFISVHCNSNKSKTPSGTETYVMGLHRSVDNLEVAKRENSSILMENDYEANYGGFNPNSPEAYIIFSLYQNAFLNQSLNVAAKVEDQFKSLALRSSRGVKQAGYLVLYKTSMPSILVETGFISNPTEEKFLASAEGQDYLASAIFRAFSDYKNEIEGVKESYVDRLKRLNDPATNAPGTKPTITSTFVNPRTKTTTNKRSANFDQREVNPFEDVTYSAKTEAPPPTEKEYKEQQLAKQKAADKAAYKANKTSPETQYPAGLLDRPKPKITGNDSVLIIRPVPGAQADVARSNIEAAKPGSSTYYYSQQYDKSGKDLDIEKIQREKDKKEFETYSRQRLEQERIREDAEKRLQQEMEARMAAEAEQVKRDADRSAAARLLAEQKREAALNSGNTPEQLAYDAKVKKEMEILRKARENEYALKRADAKKKANDEAYARLKGRTQSEDEYNRLNNNTYSESDYKRTIEKAAQNSSLTIPVPGFAPVPPVDSTGSFYAVQIGSSRGRISRDSAYFRGLRGIAEDKSQTGVFKYVVGQLFDFNEAVNFQRSVRDAGFRDAFIVAYNNGRRVNLFDASEVVSDKTRPKPKPTKPLENYETIRKVQAKPNETGRKSVTPPVVTPTVVPPKQNAASYASNIPDIKNLSFRVQVMATNELLDPDNKRFAIAKGQKVYRENVNEKMYRYILGDFKTYEDATDYMRNMRAGGFKDAFVVAYSGNRRIQLSEARQLYMRGN